jgi:hypothetical protein
MRTLEMGQNIARSKKQDKKQHRGTSRSHQPTQVDRLLQGWRKLPISYDYRRNGWYSKGQFPSTRHGTGVATKEMTDFSFVKQYFEQQNLHIITFVPKSNKL